MSGALGRLLVPERGAGRGLPPYCLGWGGRGRSRRHPMSAQMLGWRTAPASTAVRSITPRTALEPVSLSFLFPYSRFVRHLGHRPTPVREPNGRFAALTTIRAVTAWPRRRKAWTNVDEHALHIGPKKAARNRRGEPGFPGRPLASTRLENQRERGLKDRDRGKPAPTAKVGRPAR